MFYKKVIGGNTEECTGNYLSNTWSITTRVGHYGRLWWVLILPVILALTVG